MKKSLSSKLELLLFILIVVASWVYIYYGGLINPAVLALKGPLCGRFTQCAMVGDETMANFFATLLIVCAFILRRGGKSVRWFMYLCIAGYIFTMAYYSYLVWA
jgi:hypothetical protein